ncbi:ribonuclease H-like domain-containing protein [Tanacetum coccineum]
MNNEMEALFRNNTWILTDLPVNINIVRCKWLFKIKYKSSGEIGRYKARLVAKGYSQRKGNDYEETFSDVVKMQNVSLSHIETEKDKRLKSLTEYPKLVGELIYLFATRPNISYYVYCLYQHIHSPLQSHFSAALRVLRYLKQSPGSGIQFYHGNKLNLHAYSDADRAKCLSSRKSVSGLCVYLCGNLVSWKSKKQATLSMSSTEAEYRCMTSTTCEVIWLVNVMKDLNVDGVLPVPLYCGNLVSWKIIWLVNLLKDLNVDGVLVVPLYCDSTSVIQIAANLVFHEKTKHFEIDVHLVREKVTSGVISTINVNLAQQVIDIFTKSLSITQYKRFCLKLNMIDMFGV